MTNSDKVIVCLIEANDKHAIWWLVSSTLAVLLLCKNSGQVVHMYASDTKQYNLVPCGLEGN